MVSIPDLIRSAPVFERPLKSCRRARRSDAFTLLEIMIVVAIIALLSMIALPSLLRARQQTSRTRFVEMLRTIRDAADMYATENSRYPLDQGPGVIPTGLATYLGRKVDWSAKTPIGGKWDWDLDYYPGFKAGISVSEPEATVEEMTEIDAMMDDGNLATGAFRATNATVFTYVIE